MKNNGQTLIETILSTTVIAIGLIAILSLVISSLGASGDAKGRTQGAFFAQEYLENIKNIRDSNYKSGAGQWDSNINYSNDGYYKYDATTNPPLMTYLAASKTTWTDSDVTLDGVRFTPYIRVARYNSSDDELQVTVEVNWQKGGAVKLSTVLANWKP